MMRNKINLLVGALMACVCGASVHAQMAQSPLLSKTVGQVPNITLVFDDSGSMNLRGLYQYGGSASGNGRGGPNNDVSTAFPFQFHDRSPDVNQLYYDPRVTYTPRVNANGTFQTPGSTAAISSFDVYFYNPGATTLYSVSGVSLSPSKGSGYPSSGVTGTFNAAPPGGTTATANVTTAPSGTAASVTMGSIGSGYPASGITATFSAPAAGGVQATGTVTIASSSKVNTVTVNAMGSGYNAGTTATFSAPSLPGGIQATGTPIITTRNTVASVTVSNHGTGFPASGKTITFSSPPAGGVTATGTVNVATYYGVLSANKLSGGSGYTSTPTVIFSAPPPGGTTATGTAVRSAGAITSITITSPGSGYLTAPTISFSGGGGGSGASYTANLNAGSIGISSITITNPGSGYTGTPTITLGGAGGGSGQTLAVVTGTSNVVTGLTVTNAGSGYATAPTITLSSPGSGAAFTPNLSATNVITGINITNAGAGYATVPTITLSGTGSGSGATWTVNPGTTNVIQSITVTNGGSGYLAPPTFTIAALTGSGATPVVATTTTSIPGVNKEWDGTGTPTTATSYFTPGYTPDANSPLASGANVIAYPNTADSNTTAYPKFRDRTDCTSSTTSCSWAEEVQNYANWLTYHSTRLAMAKTGIGLAFQPLGATFRLGYGTINSDLEDNSRLRSGVRLFGDDAATSRTTTTDFLTWLYGVNAPGDTPNRTAINKVGQYYMRKDDDGPWGNNPSAGTKSTNPATGTANANHAACRRNYALLVTDGYYNETYTGSDSDTTTGQTNEAGVTYVPIGPYSDTISGTAYVNSFADIAHKYWFKSLRPDLSQTALQSKPNDTATWPHMNFYAIGLGIVGTLDISTPAKLDAVKAALTGDASTIPPRTLNWPTITNSNPKAIDDMWHATINGRGLFLNAGSTSKLKASIKQIISDVSGLQDSQAGVAASATSLSTTTKKYTPLFTSQYWTGDVQAHWLNATTGNENGLAWEVETKISTDPTTGISTYVSTIPAYNLRNIYVGNGLTTGTRAVPFNYSAMSSAGLIGTDYLISTANANLVNYLRGDANNEATEANVAIPTAIYRPRQTRLGDIINSTPVFVKNNVDMLYDQVPGVTGYRAFVNTKNSQRQEGVLFVGANDGMLHAFRDGSTAAGGNAPSASPGGEEVFAYVPRALLPMMHKLSDNINFTHRYFVDGPIVETDAYFTGAGSWANLVLGTTGGGAGADSSAGVSPRAAVFAINTTALNTDLTSLNASSVAWEVSSYLPAFDELGYVQSDVQSGPMLDGTWVAIFGNGFESKSCKAQLFIVNIETGALVKKIDTNVGSCSPATSKNGLGGVAVVRNDKQEIIGAYAGDLQGNMWKFDLNSTSSSNWKVDFGGDPLYKTATDQPITAAPSVIDLATTPAVTTPKPGYMVVFGTGKFYETSDLTTTTTQAIFGIWDNQLVGASSTATGSPRRQLSQLVPLTTSEIADGTNGIDFSAGKQGWYLNLTNSGERSIYGMPILVNRFILDTTLAPSVGTADPCVVGTGGVGRQYVIDALSGKSLLPPYTVPPEPPPPPIPDCITNCTNTTTTETILSSAPTAKQIEITCQVQNNCPVTPPAGATKIKRREWRQLFVR